MASYDLNAVLKAKAASKVKTENEEVKLDDVTRVKVLSPGRKVLKRFVRNRLAIVGFCILATIFFFSFFGPIFYPYGQTKIFYTFKSQNIVYGKVVDNTTFTGYVLDPSVKVNTNTNSYMTTYIKEMKSKGLTSLYKLSEDGCYYTIDEKGEDVYTLSRIPASLVCRFGENDYRIGTYDATLRTFKYADGVSALGEDFEKKAAAVKGNSGSFEVGGITYTFTKGSGKSYDVYGKSSEVFYEGEALGKAFEKAASDNADSAMPFEFGGKTYIVEADGSSYICYELGETKLAKVFSTLRIDTFETGLSVSEEFRNNALMALYTTGSFTADGKSYNVVANDESFVIYNADGTEFGEFTTFVARRADGSDTMEYGLKKALAEQIDEMSSQRALEWKFTYRLPMQNEDGSYAYDENGVLQYSDSEITIVQQGLGGSDAVNYIINCQQITYVIDRFAAPSIQHVFGTDGDGFDVLARIMYGGRVSLMVGFVVVILELILGVIMGGLAGYYGGWVDNLIMRLVDIFYCLPSTPIMIILGAMMDAMRMDVYTRLYIMMAALGIMGWAGTARMVRGQILSFREQEFMIAAEATGLKVRTRIFKHLVPNVMPQLIVSATMGMGGTILTESTLSYLGLGVKHPLATWGTMINSVSSASAMAHYAYIWIPVGLLICLTVVAFNFVGDGLRDAYDPKSKR